MSHFIGFHFKKVSILSQKEYMTVEIGKFLSP